MNIKRQVQDKFSKIDMKMVKKLAEYGHDDAFMASFFGVPRGTWAGWKSQHSNFFTDLNRWKSIADKKVERAMFETAIGFEYTEMVFEKTGSLLALQNTDTNKITFEQEYRKKITVKRALPDITAQKMWLKNRDPEHWKDRVEMQHSGTTELGQEITKARKRLADMEKEKNKELPVSVGADEGTNGESKLFS